jgi:1-acyl-sn-glycerol-3-phosphate acyltransferase
MDVKSYLFYSARSFIFYLGLIAITVFLGVMSCFIWAIPFSLRQRIFARGNQAILAWLQITCNVQVTVSGLNNIPTPPFVAVCNHQSAWESFFLQQLLQPTSFVLKRELLWLPFFGWSVAASRPIAIRRSTPRTALRYLFREGHKRLKEGTNVVIYPEGTRQPIGRIGPFKTGAAALAKKTGVPLLPIAHNAGSRWPVSHWIKTPGTIELSIGEPLDTTSANEKALSENAKSWIASELSKMATLSDA